MKKILPKSIKPEEFISLVKHTRKADKQAKIAFLLAFGTGLRLSEVLHLQQEDIKDDRIFVRQGKYGKDRIVPLPKGWKSWMVEVLPIKKTGRSLQRNFMTAARKAGLDSHYTFHSLRHGFATTCLEKGVPINQVQILLGHSNVSTTSIYIRANPKDALESYEELF